MKKINLKIKGMMCKGCEKRVKNALQEIEELDQIQVDYQTGTICATLKTNTAKNKMEEVIKELGYTMDEE